MFTFICPNVDVIFGYTGEEVAKGSNISFLLGSAVIDVDELGTKGEVSNIERVITDKTGEQHTLLVTVKRVDIKGGTVLYVCRDITERKRIEEALRESQRDLNHAQAVAQTGSWRLYVRHDELLWSDENHRLFGIPKETPMTYEKFLSTVHPEDREYVDGKWKAALHGEPYDIEHRIVVGNEIRWVRERAELEFDPQGMLKSGFGTTQDITAHKQVEKMKEEFISLVSHELRTPLTIVIGSLGTAMSEGIPLEDMRMLLQNAAEGAHSLANILENMLELARYQVGRLQLHVESVGIADVTKLVAKKLKGQGTSQQFLMDFPVDLPSVAGDPLRVERVLYNLVENATKYSPAQSEIKIFARKEKDYVVTGVTDQGRGIPLDDMDKLFEPFQQLEGGSQSSQGLGLGLVVCNRLVESQGGWIKVDSELGRGSTFFFALPIGTKTE